MLMLTHHVSPVRALWSHCAWWARSCVSAGTPTVRRVWRRCASRRPCRSSAWRRTSRCERSPASFQAKAYLTFLAKTTETHRPCPMSLCLPAPEAPKPFPVVMGRSTTTVNIISLLFSSSRWQELLLYSYHEFSFVFLIHSKIVPTMYGCECLSKVEAMFVVPCGRTNKHTSSRRDHH